jgi:hypothetical protein
VCTHRTVCLVCCCQVYNATVTPSLADCSHHIIDCDPFSPFATWLSRPDTQRYLTSLRFVPAVVANVKLVDSAWIDHVIRTGKIDDERFAVDFDRVRRDGETARLGAQEAQMKADKAMESRSGDGSAAGKGEQEELEGKGEGKRSKSFSPARPSICVEGWSIL